MSVLPKEWTDRVAPEGIALGTLVAGGAYFVLPIFQAGMNKLMHEQLISIPPDQLGLIAIGTFAAANILNGLINLHVIKKRRYSADLHITAPVMGLGMELGLLAGIGINVVWGTVANAIFNPNEWIAWMNLAESYFFGIGNNRIFPENLISRSALGFAYLNTLNAVILAGGGPRLARMGNNVQSGMRNVRNRILKR